MNVALVALGVLGVLWFVYMRASKGDPMQAKQLVDNGALLLDVRQPHEFQERNIAGAINVPVGELDTHIPDIERRVQGDRSHPIVVYCRSGARSGMAKRKLEASGFTAVTNLGGIDDWPQ